MGGFFTHVKTTKRNIYETYIRRKLDIFYQNAFSQLGDPSSKLRTYGKIKTESGFEGYLNHIPVKDRTAFTKLRLSNHQLMIEKMRHQVPKPPEGNRRCPFCPGLVEDEVHFLLTCPTFAVHRTPLMLLATNTIPEYNTFGDTEKFVTLMTDFNIIKTTAKYIRTAFEVREFLTRPHKCNG